MITSRRRFLSIVAGLPLLSVPSVARSELYCRSWRGVALGADAEIVIAGNGKTCGDALAAAVDTVRRMERLFSLHDPASALSELNASGRLAMPPEFQRLTGIVARVHSLTRGLFDPTVQPVFMELAERGELPSGGDLHRLLGLTGWHKLVLDGNKIALPQPGMALTFNGIAQGFATDRVIETLEAHGIGNVVANIGEFRSSGMAADIAVEGTHGRVLSGFRLQDGAVATSSSRGTLIGRAGQSHILSPVQPQHEPVWQTASVQAGTAAMADALSTALVLAPGTSLARNLVDNGLASAVLLEDADGGIVELRTTG
jgi:thiamine biosynthesis lipoprotein